MKSSLLAAALCLAGLATPALAQDACTKPQMPVIDATAVSVSMEAMLAARKDTQAFIQASDDYQSCVLAAAKAKVDAAKAAKQPVDGSIAKQANDEVAANQKDKEKVGKAYNAAVAAYKAAHPS